MNLENLFNTATNFKLIENKFKIYKTYEVNYDNYPVITNLETIFKDYNTGIQIYKGLLNYIQLSNKNNQLHKININFYTNTNLIIYIQNLLPLNQSVIRMNNLQYQFDSLTNIRLYTDDNVINLYLSADRNGYIINFNLNHFNSILDKIICYINPYIYLDYLFFSEDNNINTFFGKAQLCDRVMQSNMNVNETVNNLNNDIIILNDEMLSLNKEIDNLNKSNSKLLEIIINKNNFTNQLNNKILKLEEEKKICDTTLQKYKLLLYKKNKEFVELKDELYNLKN